MKILIFLLVFYFINIFAHIKLINYSPSFDNPHEIYPEISKAYYSKLEGEPIINKIESERDFLFYTGILSPNVNDNYKWLSIEVLNENKEVIYNADMKFLDFGRPYARDWYWKGPEIELKETKNLKLNYDLPYYIKVG